MIHNPIIYLFLNTRTLRQVKVYLNLKTQLKNRDTIPTFMLMSRMTRNVIQFLKEELAPQLKLVNGTDNEDGIHWGEIDGSPQKWKRILLLTALGDGVKRLHHGRFTIGQHM